MRVLKFALFALFLAGCGGGGQTSVVPSTGSATNPNVPAIKGKVTFTILVPKSTTSALRPAYVSPATQSMTVNITGIGTTTNPTGFPTTVGLTPTSTGCSSSLASTACTLQLALNPGSYSASISTFDSTNGTGNALSTSQAVAFTIVASQNNVVPLTLSGIPAKIQPNYLGNGKFLIAALDADNNFIVGAGAPQFTVAKSGGATAVTITQPTIAAPDAFSIAGSTLGTETLTITASYPAGATSGCTQPGAVCTSNFTTQYAQVLWVLNYDASSVLGFTLPLTGTNQSATYSYGEYYPYTALAVDTSGNMFFGDYYDTVGPVEEVATPFTAAPTTLFQAAPYSLTVAPNGDLFEADYTTGNILVYASPYTGTPAATITGAATEGPYFMTTDTKNDLFISNGSNATVTEYAPPYTSLTATISVGSDPSAIYFDASGNLWVQNYSSGTVMEFSPPFSNASTPVATISSGISEPWGPGAFDASGNLYVANYDGGPGSVGSITEYSPPFSNSSAPIATITTNKYPYGGCFVDASGNLYALNYEGGANSEGGIQEFTPPFSNSSTAAITASSTLYYPYLGALSPKVLTVSI